MSFSHMEPIVTVLAFVFVVITSIITSIGAYRLGLRQMEVSRELSKQQTEASSEAAKRQWEVQLTVAKHQIIAPMRQAWINRLRERISTYIAISAEMVAKLNDPAYPAVPAFRELVTDEEEIYLLLHKGEPDHDAIVAEVHKINKLVGRRESVAEAHVRLREIAQKVLKDEWEVTKKMELKTPAL